MFILFFLLIFRFSISKEIQEYQDEVDLIIKKAKSSNHFPYKKVAEMCDTFGSRILGSPSLQDASNWLEQLLNQNKFENVKQELVPNSPYWVRREEKLELLTPRFAKLDLIGLGLSISGNIKAELIVVQSKEELDELGEKVKGKIVVYDYPWVSYSDAVNYRFNGGLWASQYGAVGALIRSATGFSMNTVHTGTQNADYSPRIMTACITAEDASMLRRMQQRGEHLSVSWKMNSKLFPNENSTNVIGEFEGTTKKEEIIVLGGHIDTWDISPGAMDDTCGILTTMAAVKVLIDLGLRPKRTIRFVAFAGEEFGGYGGKQYAIDHEKELKNHIFAFESDMGCFNPYGIYYNTKSEEGFKIIEEITSLTKKIGTNLVKHGGGGLDIGFIHEQGVPMSSIITHNENYFNYHHTKADRIEVLDADDLDLNVALIASLAYVIADMEETLPRP